MWSVIPVVWAVSAVGMLVFMINASRMTKSSPANWYPTDAERAFLDAQHEAQRAFENPELGPYSNEFFFKVLRALDLWEAWQGRRLCTLEGVGVYPTEVEWHAISLLNSIPSTQAAEVTM